MTANDTERNCEAHAGAGFSFRGKEGIKESLLHLGGHAGASVGNRHHHSLTTLLNRDAYLAARSHGINGVVDHVDEYFTQLDRIGFDVSFAVGVQNEPDGCEFRACLPT